MDHEENAVKDDMGEAKVEEKYQPEEAKAVQKRTRRRKAAVFLGAKSLNRVMRVVWQRKKGKKTAPTVVVAEGALEMERQSGCPMVEQEPSISKEATEAANGTIAGHNDDVISLAEGLKLCDLLEAAVTERAIVAIASDRRLMMGEDLCQENPSCEARITCASCHNEGECPLLDSATAAGIRVDLGSLILGQGDVLELDRDVDGVLEELMSRNPDCHLRIGCERCHSATMILNSDGASQNNGAILHCNDCTVIDGEVFHEEGCQSSRGQI